MIVGNIGSSKTLRCSLMNMSFTLAISTWGIGTYNRFHNSRDDRAAGIPNIWSRCLKLRFVHTQGVSRDVNESVFELPPP